MIGRKKTYIIGVEHLAVGGILKQESLKAKNLAERIFRAWSEWGQLESIDVVFNYKILENGIKSVENIDPGVKI